MDRKIRIAILWSRLSGYMNACFSELGRMHEVDLLIYYLAGDKPADLIYSTDKATMTGTARLLDRNRDDWKIDVLHSVVAFGPDAVITAGWSIPGYRYVTRRLRQLGFFIIGTCDNPWRGSLRQHLGVLSATWYLNPLFNALWVPGERAGWFANRLGYSGERLLYGLYTADSRRLMPIGEKRIRSGSEGWPERFLFVGRLEHEKGILDLARAYRCYRTLLPAPWELWVAGTGPLAHALEREPGVRILGFLQPDALHVLLTGVGAFILPSHYDPWPLVIHEMTCAGLPIICSRECGSSVELVQEGLNGLRFDAGDCERLASLMRHMSVNVDRSEYGTYSHCLASRFSTVKWARNITEFIAAHLVPCA
jgi:glycosyltransferase involved in cell wall biosynthesis